MAESDQLHYHTFIHVTWLNSH